MNNNLNENTDFINEIISINSLEKGLSKNTINAYKLDLSLMFEWLSKKKYKSVRSKGKSLFRVFPLSKIKKL